ncbi:uncharacterized protein LOC144567807 [Carex rostrata]
MACHNRSISLPTSSHPFVLKAEEELSKLKASAGSTSLTYEIILDAIKAVGCVYECINDLLCMSSYQDELSNKQQRRCIDQELEESIQLLDMCSTSRDNLDEIKYHIQNLELAIRRGESETIKSRVLFYNQLVKKANKDVKKQVVRKNKSMTGDVLAIILLMSETRDITVSLLQSVFSCLSKQAVSDKTGKLHQVSSFVQKRRIVCIKKQGNEILDIASLRVNVEKLEIGLESLFRNVIQCQVCLLNICSS